MRYLYGKRAAFRALYKIREQMVNQHNTRKKTIWKVNQLKWRGLQATARILTDCWQSVYI